MEKRGAPLLFSSEISRFDRLPGRNAPPCAGSVQSKLSVIRLKKKKAKQELLSFFPRQITVRGKLPPEEVRSN